MLLAQLARELASDLVIQRGSQVIQFFGFLEIELSDGCSPIARERDQALLAESLQRLAQRAAACPKMRGQRAFVHPLSRLYLALEDKAHDFEFERRRKRVFLHQC